MVARWRLLGAGLLVLVASCSSKGSAEGEPSSSSNAGVANSGSNAASGTTGTNDGAGMASEFATAGEPECFNLARCTSMCEQQAPSACDRLAEIYKEGWGVAADQKRARSLRHQACVAGDPAACMSSLLGDRLDGERKATSARNALEATCDKGTGRACYVLARWFELEAPPFNRPGFEPEHRAKPKKTAPARTSTDDDTRFDEEWGSDDEIDPDEFADPLELEDEGSWSDDFFDDEEDTPAPPEVAEYDEKACAAGYSYACQVVSIRMTSEQPGPYRGSASRAKELEARANELRKRDCKAGVVFACEWLGLFGDPSGYRRAAELLRRQCDLGYPPSCSELARYLEKGRGVARDPEAAAAARKRTCDLGGYCGK